MNKRIVLLVATTVFATMSFAQTRVSKEAVKKASETRIEKASGSKEKAAESLAADAIFQNSRGEVKAEAVTRGLSEVFKGELMRKITFAGTLETLKNSGDPKAQRVANDVRQLLARFGSENTNKQHLDAIERLINNFEMAMTEMGTNGAVEKFEAHVAFTNYLTSNSSAHKSKSAEDIQTLALANALKAELAVTLKEKGIEEFKETDVNGVKVIETLTEKQKEVLKAKYDEWLAACKKA